jgi:alpha,alpha-trehalase
MDLYSAAKRLSRPYLFTAQNRHDRLPIGARGIIGDGVTSALVRVDGAIDWLCFPRFDSPAVFAGILDPDKGGCSSITPTSLPFESLQSYDPDTNVLETLFRVDGQGTVRLTDFMPWSNDPRASIHEIHRRVQCMEGRVDLTATFDPRFGYGTEQTELEIRPHGVLARGASGSTLAAAFNGDVQWGPRARGGMECRFTLRPGERKWMVLSWDAPRPEPISAYRPFEHLRSTRQAWRDWARHLHYDGPWRHHVLRSALVLKLLIHAPSGGMVAAPTTSLPEWLGGSRNWDYRYVWTRDAAMSIRAANLIGYASEARDFFHFMRTALDETHALQVMYAVDGTPVPQERELSHLRGYADSRPVRIGNGARDQLQLDTSGALVDAAYLYERFGGALSLRTWRHIRKVIDSVVTTWRTPDDGIWEPRGKRRHNVHSKVMSWLALDRGSRLAPRFGDAEAAARWSGAAKEVRDEIILRGLDPTGSHFCTAYGLDQPDASLLLLPIVGFEEPNHPLIVNTVQKVRRDLSDGKFVHRYRMDDGVGGDEGAFVLCGFWLAEALAMTGEAGMLEQAQEVFAAHVESSNHLGLLAEEVDPTTLQPLGNFPQAFSHLGLINAAARIDLGLRMQDEGLTEVPHLLARLRTEHS